MNITFLYGSPLGLFVCVLIVVIKEVLDYRFLYAAVQVGCMDLLVKMGLKQSTYGKLTLREA